MNRDEVNHHLPLYMEALTTPHGREFSNLAYQLTGGRQRGRMSANANMERHRGEALRLLAVTTGNTSMVERISIIKAMPKAEAQRILECRVKRIHFETKEETDTFSSAIQNNYGHAGKEYVQYVMNNVEDAKTLLTKVQNRVDKEAGLNAENRDWSVLVAGTIRGVVVATRAGLVDYEAGRICAWVVAVVEENNG